MTMVDHLYGLAHFYEKFSSAYIDFKMISIQAHSKTLRMFLK